MSFYWLPIDAILFNRIETLANKEHLAIIGRGIDVWNGWRDENPDIAPDLSGADLSTVLDCPSHKVAFTLNQFGIEVVIEGASLSGGDFSGADLHGANFHNTNLKKADFRGANLEQAKLTASAPVGANFEGANLSRADFSHSNLAWANLSEANLKETNLKGVILDEETTLKGAKVDLCRVDRYGLESLKNHGGLTTGALMLMDIGDDVADLRASFSGIKLWFHVFALGAFLFPYAWFIALRYSEARFVENANTETIPLWLALSRYIWNGGQNWQNAWEFHLSFIAFISLAIYNVMRWFLLVKTNSLEHRQEVSGLPVRFNLEHEPMWNALLRLMSLLTWIALVILMFNTAHFMTQEIPIGATY